MKGIVRGSSRRGKTQTKEIMGDKMTGSSTGQKSPAQIPRNRPFCSHSGPQSCPQTSSSEAVKQRLRIEDRIEVFWDSRDSFFRGTVVGRKGKSVVIQYDDGTEFTQDLNDYKWRFVVLTDAGAETISESGDINFEPDDLQSSLKTHRSAGKIERGRRITGHPSKKAIESGMYLPLQVCKRVTKNYGKLMKGIRKSS